MPRELQPSRPHHVARMNRYQLSITLTEAEVDKLEALRIQWAARSWNEVVRRLLDAHQSPEAPHT